MRKVRSLRPLVFVPLVAITVVPAGRSGVSPGPTEGVTVDSAGNRVSGSSGGATLGGGRYVAFDSHAWTFLWRYALAFMALVIGLLLLVACGGGPSIEPGADLSHRDLSGRDLSGRDLTQADLTGADLSGATLNGVILNEAKLGETNLNNADLTGANLTGADLAGAHMNEVALSGANLSNANMSNATPRRADLTGADLSGANLTGADLAGADMSRAALSGANLSNANMTNASLIRADLTGADLSHANLAGASLVDASLGGTNLSGANLNDAKFGSADLTGANLSGATLDRAQLQDAVGVTDDMLDTAASLVRTELDSEEEIAAALKPVCGAGGVEQAAVYTPGPGLHRIVLLTSAGEPLSSVTWDVESAAALPEDWLPTRVHFVELVACIEESREVIETCAYTGPSITRYQYYLAIKLMAAQTGQTVATETLRGDPPRECQSRESFDVTVLGVAVTGGALVDWLRPFVAP